MNAGIRLILRTASICGLGLAASLPLAASTQAAPSPHALAKTAPHPPTVASTQPCPQPPLAAPANSLTRRFTPRIFLESTVAPATEALKTARLRAPTQLHALPLPESPALRTPSTFVANRQRAP